VACAESVARNLGDPAAPRRTNCGSQAGRPAQRQGEPAPGKLGVRLVHSNSRQGPGGPEASEGANPSTPPAQETSAVRTTAPNWPTSLRTIASCGEEPGAGKPLAGICEGGAGQPASLPRSLSGPGSSPLIGSCQFPSSHRFKRAPRPRPALPGGLKYPASSTPPCMQPWCRSRLEKSA
jgi:hypothetical protein